MLERSVQNATHDAIHDVWCHTFTDEKLELLPALLLPFELELS